MRIEPASREEICYVVGNCRDGDLAEFSAMNPFDSRQDMAKALCARYMPSSAWLVGAERFPICIGMVFETRPHVISLGFVATPAFSNIAKPLTRFIRQRLFPHMREAGVHRIEAISLSSYEASHRWLRALGMEPEAEFSGYGKNGENFLQFAWVDNDVRQIGNQKRH